MEIPTVANAVIWNLRKVQFKRRLVAQMAAEEERSSYYQKASPTI